jgi:hypothetical protein
MIIFQNFCKWGDGHLVKAETDAENRFLKTYFQDSFNSDMFNSKTVHKSLVLIDKEILLQASHSTSALVCSEVIVFLKESVEI